MHTQIHHSCPEIVWQSEGAQVWVSGRLPMCVRACVCVCACEWDRVDRLIKCHWYHLLYMPLSLKTWSSPWGAVFNLFCNSSDWLCACVCPCGSACMCVLKEELQVLKNNNAIRMNTYKHQMYSRDEWGREILSIAVQRAWSTWFYVSNYSPSNHLHPLWDT